jgi:DNA (cytosine-5)-methyltransferase 1
MINGAPKIVGFDLFCGAGGMSLGARSAGIPVRLAVELDHAAALTYRANHPETTLLQTDVRALTALPRSPDGAFSVFFGGPPCQGFSTSNQRTRNGANDGNWLYEHFFRIADGIRPEWIVFENVRGVLDTDRGSFVKRVFDRLVKMRYLFAYGLLNAADFGVPQERERFFVVATRLGFMPMMPRPRIGRKITVRDAIWDLPTLANGASNPKLPYRALPRPYARQLRGMLTECCGHLVSRNAPRIIERYKCIKAGGNWEQIPIEMMGNYKDSTRCHTGIYRRLRWDQPSVVIGNFRKNMLIHPSEHRSLSVREAARIQSFPDAYKFLGSIGFQQQQVGNAVPPILARAVFRSIVAQTAEWETARRKTNRK